MPQPHSSLTYTKYHAKEYVHLLGLHRYPSPEDHLDKRDIEDYRQRLIKLIEANKTRDDAQGQWETMFAKQALRDLEKQ